MANTFQVTGSLLFQAPAGSQTLQQQASLQVTTVPTGSSFNAQVYNATTSITQPTTPGVTSLGYVFFRNLDPTNFVQVGAASGQWCSNLAAGDIGLVKWNGNNIYVLANTANVSLQIIAFSL
jgi:LPS O-antigen subunit length determinant protein (WzzB/FepE family)